jgi:hypothetical protein
MLARGIAILFHVVPADPEILRGSDVHSHIVTLHADDAHGDFLTHSKAFARLSGKRKTSLFTHCQILHILTSHNPPATMTGC